MRNGETDWNKQSDLLAKDQIAGWSNFTPLDALAFGYEDFESLPVGADGCIVYSEATAAKLFRECLISQFRNHIDDCGLSIAREVAAAKKREAA